MNLFFRHKGVLPLLMVPLFFSFVIHSNNSYSGTPPVDEMDKSIKIGLLITVDTSENALTRQAVDAVQLVLDQVNDTGGIYEKKVEAFVKSVDGNWGAGSKQSVSLIYENEVRALLGFVDGRSAHLIEQVCTKAEIPFISTFSPDPTLSRINIPWFFSSMPHAGQQSKVLANEIYKKQERKNITVISSDDYDHSYLTRSFLREAEKMDVRSPSVLTYQAGNDNFDQIVPEISGSASEGIVFFGSSDEWNALISKLNLNNIHVPFFLPIMELDESLTSDSMTPVYTIMPENWKSEEGKDFRGAFHKRYGYQPGILASYVYDGAIALLEAIKVNGEEKTGIQEGLFNIDLNGLTGRVSFDSSGMTKGELNLIQVNSSLTAQ